MRRTTYFLTAAILFAAFHAAPAFALNGRSFVSGLGADTNSCGLASPCRTFARAISQTSAGGEVTVLDSAGYGSATITRSIAIISPGGVEASITPPSGQNAITITAPSTADITLRGLTLFGGGVGANGIALNSGAGGSLSIIGCVVKDFAGNGVAIQPSAGTLAVLISDTYALHNGGDGVDIGPTSLASVQFSINQVTANDNANGIYLDASGSSGRVNGVISGSHVDDNSNNGITAAGNSGFFNIYVHIKDSYTNRNGGSGVSAQNTGLAVGFFSGTGILLNDVYSLSNGVDIANSGSSIFTFGNNVFSSTSGTPPAPGTLR